MLLFLDGLEPGKTEALIRYVYVVYVCTDVAILFFVHVFFSPMFVDCWPLISAIIPRYSKGTHYENESIAA